MKIAHFLVGRCNPESANGVDKTVYHLSRSQAALGHKVAVFSLTAKPSIPIPEVIVKTYVPLKFPFILPKSLLKELSEWQPDILHLHSVYTPTNAMLAHQLKSQGIPYVVTAHGGLSLTLLRRRWYLKIPYKFIFELPTLNQAMFIHAVADEDDILNYGVKAPIITAPNGLDLSIIPTDLNKDLLSSRFPQVRGKRVFMFLGRLDPFQKGLDLLLKGFSLANIKNAVIVLVGPDEKAKRKTLESLSRELGIASQVIFTGPAYGKEKFNLLAGADVFVHPSRWEGVPFSILEAAAASKPCLITPEADPLGMLLRYQGSIVVRGDARSISEGFKRFEVMSSSELQAMGTKARQMVKSEFTWNETALRLVEGYCRFSFKRTVF